MKSAYVSINLEFSMFKFDMELSANYTFESKRTVAVSLGFPVKVYEPFSVKIEKDGTELEYEIFELENISDEDLESVLYGYRLIVANVTFNPGENLIVIKLHASSDLKFEGYFVEYPLITAKYWNVSGLEEVVELYSNKKAASLEYPFFDTREYVNQRETLEWAIIICTIVGVSFATWILFRRKKSNS